MHILDRRNGIGDAARTETFSGADTGIFPLVPETESDQPHPPQGVYLSFRENWDVLSDAPSREVAPQMAHRLIAELRVPDEAQ